MLFRLKEKVGGHRVAPHSDEKGVEYRPPNTKGGFPGDIIEDSRDLVKLFPNKFERIQEEVQTFPKSKPKIPVPSPAMKGKGEGDKSTDAPLTPPEEEKTEEDGSKYGKDVSSLFPLAKEVEMKVYEQNHWYTIVDVEDGEVMNEKKLRENQVNKFLEQYREEA